MINKAAAWSLEYVYCSGCSGGMVQFNYGLAEVRRHASLDTDYTHGYLTTTWGWVWQCARSSSLAQPSPKHGGCTGTFSMSLSLSLSLPLSLSYSLSLYLCPLMIIQ